MLFSPDSATSSTPSMNADMGSYQLRTNLAEGHQQGLLTQLCSMPDTVSLSDQYLHYQDTYITDYYKQCKPFSSHGVGFNFSDFTDVYCQSVNHDCDIAQQMKQRRKPHVPKPVVRERQLRRNERERARQNRLNNAFDVLRDALPSYLAPHKNGQKLTQIETLRLAKHYILSLKSTLEEADENLTSE